MDLQIIKIEDRGSNTERLIMKAVRKCNLNEFIVLDTTYDEDGIVSNKHRHVYVMPDIDVEEGDFIWLYTCRGNYATHKNDSKTITHKLYWGLEINVWNNDGDKAYVIHYDDWTSKAAK